MARPGVLHRRYVAHFDMLGFKSATLRNSSLAWNALRNLRLCMDRMPTYTLQHMKPKRVISRRLETRIFSDTILVFTLGDEDDDLTAMLLLTSQLFSDALARCIPLRGGISHGDFFVDSDLQLYCGVPFVKAYELGERAQWYGITLDQIVAERFLSHPGGPLTTGKNIPTIIQWNVPLKVGGSRTSWVVNWPVIFREGFSKHPPLSVEEYYEPFELFLGPYRSLASDAKAKHENTAAFINAQFDALSHAQA